MPETPRSETLPVVLTNHRAVRAWRQLHPSKADPERLEIVKLKHKTAVYRLCGVGPDGGAVVAKRCRSRTAEVETLVYGELLPAAGVPALSYFGCVPEAPGEFSWLFLEDAGTEVYWPACQEHRVLASRWLAALHSFKPRNAALPDRSPSYYLELIRFSRAAMHEYTQSPLLAPHERELLRTLVGRYDLVQTRWDELQRFFEAWAPALVHGDFVIKNLRLRSGAIGPELMVFDWEMAGWGVPAVDLAQFVGKTVSPDLETYRAARMKCDPELTAARLERLAAYGNLLRLVEKVYWEAITLKGPTYDFLSRPITTLKGYEPQLAEALRAISWTDHD